MTNVHEALAGLTEPVNHMEYLLGETYREMLANIKRWGHQSHPVMDAGHWRLYYETLEAHYKSRWAHQTAEGATWDVILLEEVYESLAERVPAKQVEELVQVAAVALAMAEDLMTQQECSPTCAPHLVQFCSPECEERARKEGGSSE